MASEIENKKFLEDRVRPFILNGLPEIQKEIANLNARIDGLVKKLAAPKVEVPAKNAKAKKGSRYKKG